MNWSRIRFVTASLYTWIAMVGCGGIAVETIVIYPNVFHDPPDSLEGATRFFQITGPADFFPPLGALTAVAAVTTVVLTARIPRLRIWSGASLTSLVLGEWVFSALYFWPRNDIMFEEGPAVHSAEVLRRTATEFEIGHWGRMACAALTAALALVVLLRVHRAGIEEAERR